MSFSIDRDPARPGRSALGLPLAAPFHPPIYVPDRWKYSPSVHAFASREPFRLPDVRVRRNNRGLRRPAENPPRLPGDTPVLMRDRSNGDDMDALIKSLNPRKTSKAKASEAKAPEVRPAELDPAEFLAA